MVIFFSGQTVSVRRSAVDLQTQPPYMSVGSWEVSLEDFVFVCCHATLCNLSLTEPRDAARRKFSPSVTMREKKLSFDL